jgi:formylglycine-generating enzyme required for sulfatase activity
LETFRQEFVAVTPGAGRFPNEFQMGRDDGSPAERPRHPVRFGKPFWISKYEVPQNLWQAVMGSNPSRWQGPRNSVENLSFDEAQKFCRQVTELLRTTGLITEKQSIRLPTEAEWEYCARAGSKTLYSFGDDPQLLDEYAWHTGNAAGNDPPVGAKKPNAWGLFDIHGYLWEWCQDPWHDHYDSATANGSSWTVAADTQQRVLRSGSWKDKADRLTSSFRIGRAPDTRDDAIGLRCVLSE